MSALSPAIRAGDVAAVLASGGDCAREDLEGRIPLAVANTAQLAKLGPLLMRSSGARPPSKSRAKGR